MIYTKRQIIEALASKRSVRQAILSLMKSAGGSNRAGIRARGLSRIDVKDVVIICDSQASVYIDVAMAAAENSRPGSAVVDVLRYFAVRWETRDHGALNAEWSRETKGMSARQVFEVFAAAQLGEIKLPSHFRECRKRMEMQERSA